MREPSRKRDGMRKNSSDLEIKRSLKPKYSELSRLLQIAAESGAKITITIVLDPDIDDEYMEIPDELKWIADMQSGND